MLDRKITTFEAALAHDLNENWNVQLGMAYEDSSADGLQSRPLQVFGADYRDGDTARRFVP